MEELILNYLPPTDVKWASPPISTLKGFMKNNGYDVKVHYWNISLEEHIKNFFGPNSKQIQDEFFSVVPFLNYIAIKNEDNDTFDKIRYFFSSLLPHLINDENFSFESHLQKSANDIYELIQLQLNKLEIHKCKLFGVSAKLYQLLPANVLCEIVKELSPDTKIVIGGIGTKEEALAIMKNFKYYDFAVWGEGEYVLLELYKCILSNDLNKIENIPFIAYRNENEIKVSSSVKKIFFDINSPIIADYSDFFEQNKKELSELSIPIEGSRGCHWKKCKFCFLNDGYKYRTKNINNIIEEINNQINRYNVKKFLFLDNDMVGRDVKTFESLLDSFILLRQTHEDFEIVLAEIISKELNSYIVKKMALAGFSHVQIGYESPSDFLLKKISKKNSFASNLLFMKWAKYYAINVGGLNILRGLLDETDNDIKEAIDNFHFLRFILNDKIRYNISGLAIGNSSKYYKEIVEKDILEQWCENPYTDLLSKKYYDYNDRFKLFFFTGLTYNKLWIDFEKTANHYYNNHYEYHIIQNNENIYYQETYNGKKIKEIEFDEIIHWNILREANNKVISLSDIRNSNKFNIEEHNLISIIDDLKKEYLIYSNIDYSEIVSIINTDMLSS